MLWLMFTRKIQTIGASTLIRKLEGSLASSLQGKTSSNKNIPVATGNAIAIYGQHNYCYSKT